MFLMRYELDNDMRKSSHHTAWIEHYMIMVPENVREPDDLLLIQHDCSSSTTV